MAQHKLSVLERIPAEIQHSIVVLLPTSSVLSLIRTSKALYRAFKRSERNLVNRIISNEIPRNVRFEAFVAYRAFADKPVKGNEIEDFLDQFLQERTGSISIANLRQALAMSKLHTCVDLLSKSFIKTAFASRPPTSPLISADEMGRFQRSFYYFEIYRLLFRNVKQYCPAYIIDTVRLELASFLRIFSPWERNQLCCVWDYLETLVAPMANQIQEHDVEWGARTGLAYPIADIIPCFLVLGLSAIYKMETAQCFTQKWDAIYTPGPPCRLLLREQIGRYDVELGPFARLRDYSAADEDNLIRKPFFKDPDEGPELTWRWTHRDSYAVNFVNHKANNKLRGWAYVMWDKRRIEEWGDVLQVPLPITNQLQFPFWAMPMASTVQHFSNFSASAHATAPTPPQIISTSTIIHAPTPAPAPAPAQWSGLWPPQAPRLFSLDDLVRDRQDVVAKSAQRKREIFTLGGRGWWGANDESRVVWPAGASPRDGEEARARCLACLARKSSGTSGDRCRPHRFVLKMPVEEKAKEKETRTQAQAVPGSRRPLGRGSGGRNIQYRY